MEAAAAVAAAARDICILSRWIFYFLILYICYVYFGSNEHVETVMAAAATAATAAGRFFPLYYLFYYYCSYITHWHVLIVITAISSFEDVWCLSGRDIQRCGVVIVVGNCLNWGLTLLAKIGLNPEMFDGCRINIIDISEISGKGTFVKARKAQFRKSFRCHFFFSYCSTFKLAFSTHFPTDILKRRRQ